MTRPRWVKHSSAAIAALALVSAAGPPGLAQQPPPSARADLLDKPQVLRTTAGSIRVTALKGFAYPWALAFLPNGDMLVTEQSRTTLRIVRHGVLDSAPITGLPPGITSDRRDTAGVDVAIHPRFAENQLVYVAYWKPHSSNKDLRTAILVRGRFDGGNSLTDVREIFASSTWTDGPSAVRIVFGRDGKIYMTIGTPLSSGTDRSPFVSSAAWAQDPAEHAGKVLRLNDDGSVPADNPFVGRPGYKPEIYAFGIRNSIGLIVHPETGELWQTDNGPQGGDEINIIKRGLNYGWPLVTYGRAYSTDPDGIRSGLPPPSVQPPTSAPGLEEPVTFYKPSIAVSGMAFYTGDKFPQWKGNLFVGGLAGMQLSRIVFNERGLESRREALLLEMHQRIRDVRQGPDGLLYLTTDMKDGAILKIEPAAEQN
jgi:glucose/arabinose dehydrogenase